MPDMTDMTPQHAYVHKMARMYERGELPRESGAHLITVWHDSTCGIYTQSLCDCDPDIELSCSMLAGSDS